MPEQTPEYLVLQDWKGSPDGARVIQYTKGETVSLPESLADVALKEEWVELKKPADKPATKPAAKAAAKSK